jgi:acyl-CoA thioesterase
VHALSAARHHAEPTPRHPPDLSDWLLYEQHSLSGIGGRGLAQGTMFNRTGQLVCTMTLECYFGGKASG